MEGGHYVLLERLGVGGMAEVFFATAKGAEGFERPVAIKRILRNLSDDVDFVQMFVDEAKIAVQLQHPNIVQVLDLGIVDGEYFIAMEFVHGKDLRAIQDAVHQAGQRMPLKVAVHVALRVCEGLHHAHFATGPQGMPLGVVHRDVTPQNVLVSYDGEVKVADFGLAKAAGRATQTRSGVVKGKLAYMAPEAFRGLALDLRSDVYSVGILLWEMLTGDRLFLGRNDAETVRKAQAGVVPSLVGFDPAIPPELDAIVQRALARDRDDRYLTAEALHDDLEAFVYSAQQYMTTSALATWLRRQFPTGPEPSIVGRLPDPATRQLRLRDVSGALEGRGVSAPVPLETPELDEYPIFLDEEGDDLESQSLTSGLTGPLSPVVPVAGFAATAATPFDPFDDVTLRSMAEPSGARSLDGVIVGPSVPSRRPSSDSGAGVLAGPGWDDEDKTQTTTPRRSPPG